jgi:hypothetical protein
MMTNSHAAWAHLVGTNNALEDIAADVSLGSTIRGEIQAINDKAEVSNFLSKADMKKIGQALVLIGTGRRSQT